jgi:hypothetical protein
VYFETQLENHCGLHALNNVFGERLCSRGDLEETLRLMEFEAQFPDAEFIEAAPFDASLHMDSSGNYSEELLARFLATRTSWVLEFAPLTIDTVHALQSDVYYAALIHLPGHWTALRWSDGAWTYFDSLRRGPQIWCTSEVADLLRRRDVRALPLRRANG